MSLDNAALTIYGDSISGNCLKVRFVADRLGLPYDWVETSVREAFSNDIASVVVRECCWGGDQAAHLYSLDKAMKMYARIRTLSEVAAMLGG